MIKAKISFFLSKTSENVKKNIFLFSMLDIELEILSKHPDPMVQTVVKFCENLKIDPAKKHYMKLLELGELINADIDTLVAGDYPDEEIPEENAPKKPSPFKLIGDKKFDHIMAIFKNTPSILEAYKQARIASQIIEPDDQKEKRTSPVKARIRTPLGVPTK